MALLHWARRAAPACRSFHRGRACESRPAPGRQGGSGVRRRAVPPFRHPLFFHRPGSGPARSPGNRWRCGRAGNATLFSKRPPRRPQPPASLPPSGTWILTAHHRDDLVETVFQRLGRGTGPRGLRGIPFRRGRIVRPFLDRPRSGILAYLECARRRLARGRIQCRYRHRSQLVSPPLSPVFSGTGNRIWTGASSAWPWTCRPWRQGHRRLGGGGRPAARPTGRVAVS